MNIPLKFGLPLLLILWIGSGWVDDSTLTMALRIAAIGVALWTAFSLPIPPKRPPAMEDSGPFLEGDGGLQEDGSLEDDPDSEETRGFGGGNPAEIRDGAAEPGNGSPEDRPAPASDTGSDPPTRN